MRPVACRADLLINDISDACQRQARRAGLRVGMRAQERVDLAAAERPVVVEIGDDLFHERLRQPDRTILVTEMLEQDRQRELLRALALVSPFEPVLGEAL